MTAAPSTIPLCETVLLASAPSQWDAGEVTESTAKAAALLAEAARTGIPCKPVRDVLGSDRDLELAYAVQQINVEAACDAGRHVSGKKIGLTSPAVQAQLGVDQPDFGTLFADMEIGDGVEVDPSRLLQPRAEAEIALVLEHDLDRGEHSFLDVVRATAFAVPAIEIVDSRVAGWDITIVDTIADNASCGLYVVGGRPVPLATIDLPSIEMRLTINGVQVSDGTGAACLGHPLNAARWLADELCRRGTPLRAGDCVMTGALGPMRDIAPGDVVEADLGAMGTVRTRLLGKD